MGWLGWVELSLFFYFLDSGRQNITIIELIIHFPDSGGLGLIIYFPHSERRSGEIVSPRQTAIDKTNDGVVNSERRARVRGSDPLSGHSVHNTATNTWRAPARRLIQKHLSTGGGWKTDGTSGRSLSGRKK